MRTQPRPIPFHPAHIAIALVLAAAGQAFGQAEVNIAAKGRVTASSSAAANPVSNLIDGTTGQRWISNGTAVPNGDCGGTGGETITWWADSDIPIEHIEIAGARPADNGFSNYQVLIYDTKNQLVFARPTGATPCSSSVAIGSGDTNISFSTLVPASGGGTDVPVLGSRVVINFTGRSGAGGVGELRVFTKRPGSMPPLGPKPDEPVLRDDEVVMFLGSAAEGATRIGVFQPLTTSPAPTVQVRGVAQPSENAYELWPVVSAQAGRVYGAAAEQTVVLRSNGTQYVLQLLDTWAGNSTPPVRPIIRGEYLFTPSNPGSDVQMIVADIDKKLVNGMMQEEVILAYEGTETAPPNRRVVQMTVLRFDTPGDLTLIPPAPAAPTVVYNGQPRYTFPNSGPTLGILRNNGTGTNRIVLRPFRIGSSANDPDLLFLTHIASDRTTPVYAVFPAEQIGGTVAPRNATSTTTVASSLVHSTQINTPSWDAWTGRLGYSPATQSGDHVVFVTRNGTTGADIVLTPLTWTNTSQSGGVPDLEFASGDLQSINKSVNGTRLGSSVLSGLSLINNAKIETRRFNVVGLDSHPDHDGVAILSHTTRGPFVSVYGLIAIPPDGSNQFEQITNSCWPTATEATGRATYTTPTQTSFAAGQVPLKRSEQNLVANRRSAVWLYSTIAHGAMSPNRIVKISFATSNSSTPALPTTDTFTLNHADGGSGSPTVVGPIVLADIDGDSAVFQRQNTWFYAAPTRLAFDNFAAPLAIIQEPPKHIDYFRPYVAVGSPQHNQRGVFSITGDPTFVSEFENSSGAEVSSTISQTVSATVGSTSSWNVGGSLSAETPVASAEVSASYNSQNSTDVTNAMTGLQFTSSSFSFSNSVSTSFDDGLILQERDMDIWRYPLAGPTGSATADNTPGTTFMEMSIPGPLPPATFRAGKELARYQPQHINGNLLSYPLVGRLQTIATADRRPFAVGAGTTFNTFVNAVTDFSNPPAFSPTGVSSTSTITFASVAGGQSDYQTSTTNSSSSGYDITASASVGGNIFGVVDVKATVTGGYSKTFSNSNTFSSAITSRNTSTVTNLWRILLPAFTDLSPLQQQYTIRSFVFFDKAGAAKLQYAVDLPAGGGNFWSSNYSAPDAALNLPYRIIYFQNQWQLSTFPDRFKMRSFEVRDLESRSQTLNQNLGEKVVDASPAARDLAVYARVYNLSYASTLSNLASRFDMVEINPATNPPTPIGTPVFLGNGELLEDTAVEPDGSIQPPPAYRPAITSIPPRGTALVRLPLLNTDNLGPTTPTGTARTYRIMVTLDPNNAISNETHELFDRDSDPLAPGDTIFANAFAAGQTLEKGQNNFGWFDFRIGKSLCNLPIISGSPNSRSVSPGQNTTFTAQVTARIGEVLTYQWRKNGANVGNGGRFSGATTAALAITGVQAGDAGSYDLLVTNSCGSTSTVPAVLTTGCGPADVGGLGGSTGADGALTADDVVVYLTAFFANNLAVADIAGLGGTPGPNGTITPDDLIFFLSNFFVPCP